MLRLLSVRDRALESGTAFRFHDFLLTLRRLVLSERKRFAIDDCDLFDSIRRVDTHERAFLLLPLSFEQEAKASAR
jgi:hypothetical protein